MIKTPDIQSKKRHIKAFNNDGDNNQKNTEFLRIQVQFLDRGRNTVGVNSIQQPKSMFQKHAESHYQYCDILFQVYFGRNEIKLMISQQKSELLRHDA